MKRIIPIFIFVSMILMACSVRDNATFVHSKKADVKQNIGVFTRESKNLDIEDDFNPYLCDFDENGIFYFVQDVVPSDGSEEEWINCYNFSYQSFNGDVRKCFIYEQLGGYVRDLSIVNGDDTKAYCVLLVGDKASIQKYDLEGKLLQDITLPKEFNSIKEFPVLKPLKSGDYAVGLGQEVYILDESGKTQSEIKIRGQVQKLIETDSNHLYAVTVESSQQGEYVSVLARLDLEKENSDAYREVPDNISEVYLLNGDRFAACSQDYLYTFGIDSSEDEILVDLNVQDILSSQIKDIMYKEGSIQICLVDETSKGEELCILKLTERENEEMASSECKSEYTEDGRKILQVAVPENYDLQIEYHAKKYNQKSDGWYVAVERYRDTVEDYLGKGNNPDVIMLNDQTEVMPLVDKGLVTELDPLFDKQERYKCSDVLPKAWDLLGNGDKVYAMGPAFSLLLRASDKTEYDKDGKCTLEEYLLWYDEYMSKEEMLGHGELENLLYADITSFYDENTMKANFDSEEFKKLMLTYKKTIEEHEGSLIRESARDKNWLERYIALGPSWNRNYKRMELLVEGGETCGLPLSDGNSVVIMQISYPMVILSSSDCREGAFDFVMYYCSLGDYLGNGESQSDYGKSAATNAIFSTMVSVMDDHIYETEYPYMHTMGDDGVVREHYYTDNQKQKLRELIDQAVGDTKARKDIYAMLEEEMDGYLNGNKSLDEACKVLQSRVQLYLDENN